MSAITRTYTFTDGTTAYGSQVETEISTIVTAWNNHNSGTSSWGTISVSGSSSSTEISIDNTAADGDSILTFKLSGSRLYTIGIDDSDSDFLKFATTGITTNVAMQIPTSGVQIQLAAGSASVPSFSAIGDTDTGLYFSAANNISFTTGGTERMKVDSSGTFYISDGVANAPGITFLSDGDTGMYRSAANQLSFSTNGTQKILIDSAGTFYVQDGAASGPGITFLADGDTGMYRAASNSIGLSCGTVAVVIMTSTTFNPQGGGSISTGDASNYWNDISYKTLTDRGCLGCFDDGVELQDGRKVSDTEAILAIEKDTTKQTVYGVPMLKYSTFPKVAYKRAEGLERDKDGNPIGGSDGIEMTSMHSIMIGAIKELTNRVKELEKGINK